MAPGVQGRHRQGLRDLGCRPLASSSEQLVPREFPDIAISTGGADSLECLPLRIGVDATEYIPGASSAGHIHIFSGYAGAVTSTATPQSYEALWDSTGDLMKNDVVLLWCEGKKRPT